MLCPKAETRYARQYEASSIKKVEDYCSRVKDMHVSPVHHTPFRSALRMLNIMLDRPPLPSGITLSSHPYAFFNLFVLHLLHQ